MHFPIVAFGHDDSAKVFEMQVFLQNTQSSLETQTLALFFETEFTVFTEP